MKTQASVQNTIKSSRYQVVPSSDGLVRLSIEQLNVLAFSHIISGLDNISAEEFNSEQAIFSGYTEWLYENVCAITLGWDWHWQWKNGQMQCQVKGFPRSNIQLQEDGFDVSPRCNDELLLQAIGDMVWQATTAEAIKSRYRKSPMSMD
ncbi:DUF4902 domain-containing protein [Agarivorans sp. MS3-6]|uniref:DUF4902 domain-containing protein n=1 Tax=Agarivorans sp. TSD2052 TaxID=2937286 RepID=UPI00200E1748|nr:DUF4902 domain-containing protein [Agarivorans sp. TSD2052]UPW17598.1 DUF4902 domain-containing protein [Agarivorans sp. TSD2052]